MQEPVIEIRRTRLRKHLRRGGGDRGSRMERSAVCAFLTAHGSHTGELTAAVPAQDPYKTKLGKD